MIRSLLARSVSFALLFGVLALPSTAIAQSEGIKLPVSNKNVVSASPFLLMFEWANVEVERKVNEQGSFGLTASATGMGSGAYKNVQGFYRYYPQRASLTGFYIDGRAGVHRLSLDDGGGHAYGLGFDLGYAWLFGAKRNFAVSMGAGATRLFGGDMKKGSFTLPTFRLLNVGWSF